MCPFTSIAREDMHKQRKCDDACLAPYELRWQVRRDTAFARAGHLDRVASGVSRITNSVETHSRAMLDESKPNRPRTIGFPKSAPRKKPQACPSMRLY